MLAGWLGFLAFVVDCRANTIYLPQKDGHVAEVRSSQMREERSRRHLHLVANAFKRMVLQRVITLERD